MATNIVQFNGEIDAFNVVIISKSVAFHKRIAGKVLEGVVKRTPVDTGHARGNWQTTVNSTTEQELDTEDKDGAETIGEGQLVLAGLEPFETIFIQNNVPYILELEEGTGSKQAPEGMVAVTLAELGDFKEL